MDQNIKLLVVDDDDVDRERISRFLKNFKSPLMIVDASTGSEALKKVTKEQIDLILLDYNLGDMTGPEVLKAISIENNKTIPTIMITGMGDEKTAIESMRLGVFDYLPKGNLTAEKLIVTLSAALNHTKMQLELQKKNDRLSYLSLYDELTGLANRSLFFDRLSQAVKQSERTKSKFSVMMIDLNLFKEVNDTFGHQAGDEILRVVGERLSKVFRKSDTVARLGGDEFACIIQSKMVKSNLLKLIDKAIQSISQSIVIDNHVLKVGCAIGISNYPNHGVEGKTLMANADIAMYQAKSSQKNYCIYDKSSERKTRAKITVSECLFKALQNKELYMVYQPKIDLESNKIISAEALVRWNSPILGYVPPDEFIPVAERCGLIEEVTSATIEMVLKQHSAWNKQGFDIPLAINLSAKMLDSKVFFDNLLSIHNRFQISPKKTILEITETALSSCRLTTQLTLNNLIRAGFKLSIDDFGSGFTSFRQVRDVIFNEIKIDRLFIAAIHENHRDAAIVRSIVLMAKNMGMNTIAEGVELEEQMEILRSLGCNNIQGYAISPPLKAENFIQWCNKNNMI
ncbi:MAG: EAL domain-containing protein [Gammaproteobacteria bacterium]|nr:EAL domain-containing protein [Gammaproteobacteria bacterium]MDH5630083.1 EAL domain-containing protein [Gammaproteobacteria bacterium]